MFTFAMFDRTVAANAVFLRKGIGRSGSATAIHILASLAQLLNLNDIPVPLFTPGSLMLLCFALPISTFAPFDIICVGIHAVLLGEQRRRKSCV
jgi:hypothetical protein